MFFDIVNDIRKRYLKAKYEGRDIMNLKNNNARQMITFIIFFNLAAIGMIVLSIRCYLETGLAENLYGLFGLLYFVLMDILFFSIRKILFSKVFIEDGKIKEVFLKKTFKEIDLKDIKFICINIDYIFISSSEIKIEEIGVGRQLNKKLFSKENINFTMNLVMLDILLDSVDLEYCYVNKKTPKYLKEKINKYISIREIDWIKGAKKI